MMHRPHREWHDPDCRCDWCRPPSPADRRWRADRVTLLLIASGILNALVLIELLHLLAGLPGVSVLVGGDG